MKSILKIYWRYVWTACLLIVFVVCINAALGFAYLAKLRQQEKENVRTGQYQTVADQLVRREDGGYEMRENGLSRLEENGCAFALLLDAGGTVVWDWNRPAEVPTAFSVAEVAAFSKWYLAGYPVAVWRYGQDGLLVFAYPKESLVRYNLYWKKTELDGLFSYAAFFLLFNFLLVFALALLFGYRFYRALRPVGEGVEALAGGKSVALPERGLTQYLRERINQTSALLERQRRELDRRDNLRTEWIAGVSHDIRTPLSLIAGYADALERDESLPKPARQEAALIREQSFSIKKLVEDLNLTSRLAYHTKPLRRENYLPAVWLRQTAVQMLNAGEIGEKYELDMDMEEELEQRRMIGDAALLTRALKNLLGNSVRHNPEGCHIWLRARCAEGGFCFCVEDDGKGVPENVRRVLAERDGCEAASRVPAEEKEKPETACPMPSAEMCPGAGTRAPHVMGLRVAAQIAAAHGGRIWFEKDGRCVWVSVFDVK